MEEFIAKRWGGYQVLARGSGPYGFVVKKLCITPGHSISNQKHTGRRENWFVIKGEGQVMLDDSGEWTDINEGDSFVVKREQWHQVKCTSRNEPLVVIETWHGFKLDENDIEKKRS